MANILAHLKILLKIKLQLNLQITGKFKQVIEFITKALKLDPRMISASAVII